MTLAAPSRTLMTLLLTVALCLGPALVSAVATGDGEARTDSGETPLAPELLEARTVLLLDTSMHFGISSEFLDALEEWGRFERVFLPDAADVCFALSTRPDFTQEQLPGEGQGTVRVIDKLYFRVFVPGEEETLWSDEIDLDEASVGDLLFDLRQRIEEEEAGTPPADAEALDDRPLGGELLAGRKVVLRDTSGVVPLLLELRSALDDWGRYELVPTPDEADLCFAFSSEVDYSEQGVPVGGERAAAPAEEGLRPRQKGTLRTIDTLYLKVFVPGQGEEILWEDEIDATLDEPARQLVERLRRRVARAEEASENPPSEES